MGVVERIYDGFGFELGMASRAAMQVYMDAHPKGQHGKHVYDLASFGLSVTDVEQRFAFYLDDSRWPISD